MGFLPFLLAFDHTKIFHLPEEEKKRRTPEKKYTKEEYQKVEFRKNSLLAMDTVKKQFSFSFCVLVFCLAFWGSHCRRRSAFPFAIFLCPLQLRQTSCFIIEEVGYFQQKGKQSCQPFKVTIKSCAGQSQQNEKCMRCGFHAFNLICWRSFLGKMKEEVIFHQNKFHSITTAKSVNQSKSPFVAFSLHTKSILANLDGFSCFHKDFFNRKIFEAYQGPRKRKISSLDGAARVASFSRQWSPAFHHFTDPESCVSIHRSVEEVNSSRRKLSHEKKEP